MYQWVYPRYYHVSHYILPDHQFSITYHTVLIRFPIQTVPFRIMATTDTQSIGYPSGIYGNGKSPLNVGVYRKITNKWSIFHCHVWLPEGKPSIIMWRIPQKNCVASLLHRMIQFTQPVILKSAKQVGRVRAGLPMLDYENPRSVLIHESMPENRVPYATTQIPSLIIWFFPSQAKNRENPGFQYPILFNIHMKSS